MTTTPPPITDWARPPPPEPATLALPRILCLHGGGTNARIFHMQCRALQRALQARFRLVFAEAPFASTAGPDVLTVYADCGPFKRWVLTPEPNALERRPRETWAAVEAALGGVLDEDDALGASGEVVAVLGFSQGGKIAASILLQQQLLLEQEQEKQEQEQQEEQQQNEGPRAAMGRLRRGFRFGVIMAGRGPLLPVDAPADNRARAASWAGARFDYASNKAAGRVLRVPTLHVHGLQDTGLAYHQALLEDWCDADTAVLVEWEGGHRLPIRTLDVRLVVDQIMALARRTGVWGE